MKRNFTIELQDVSLENINLVGGKNASLGEMIKNLTDLGVAIPHGFAITSDAYRDFIKFNRLEESMREIIKKIDINNLIELRKGGAQVRDLIREGKFSAELEAEIIESYKALSHQYGQEATDVAVRSSATAEDLPDNSFAGQQETYLNVRGPEGVMQSVRNCMASLFTDRAISYREHFGYDHFDVGLSVCIQKMVRSDLASSGVAFSLDTESGFKNVVIINGSYGLGELIVQGSVSPDEFIVFKPTLEKGFDSIIEKNLGKKDHKMIYGDDPGELTKIVSVEKDHQNKFCLTDDQVLELSKWVCIIETYYSSKKKHWCPMDIEWAIDGLTNQLFIVQARPETIHSLQEEGKLVEYNIVKPQPDKRLLKGIAVGSKIGTGKVVIMYSMDGRDGSHDGIDFKQGDILVTEMTDPDWEPIMKKASAIVTNKGGRTCHAAIVAREMGVPAIVGSVNGTEVLEEGQTVTISCCEGEIGYAYEGKIDFQKSETNLNELPEISTPIMLNVGSPELAFRFSNIPNAGVGLAREEFIINTYIQAHPLALLHHHELGDQALSDKIETLITGYDSEESFFVQKLSFGVGKIGAAFYPNPVIVRFSDFKTNEYANLLGGNYFEPKEENPMLGWRGASRYYSEKYRRAFGLECKAIKCVREKMGLTNVVVMIPFCRTVNELLRVYEVMKTHGLERGKNGLEVYLMAEIPSNIILAEEFSEHIDGFSIGSNDLTQLTLGLDRDSSLVAELYDERNPAVKRLISNLIKIAKRKGIKVGICGQGPSDFPDFAAFLVEEGIDSISVTPDSVLKIMKSLAAIQQPIHELSERS
ncbi:MAG TPA: phosphoenolpyruvate synthase [Cyclobacteriaceae bacterium]|nr:phosphoenolpyruvate synthase [Cyclobacteriaceae bacterium]